LIKRGITIKFPGKNCLGYHASVITGKYSTLDSIIIQRPKKDIWISLTLAVTTDKVIIETIFVKKE
jgi:hypothetical protein